MPAEQKCGGEEEAEYEASTGDVLIGEKQKEYICIADENDSVETEENGDARTGRIANAVL